MDIETPTSSDTRRVLLIEDSSVTKDLIELVLTQSGHTVVCAEDGASALTALATETFDVVLVDYHLPDISGMEVVRQYLATPRATARPLFIAITGDTRGLLADRKNCEVFDRVVPKPLDIDLVSELVMEPASARAPAGPRPEVGRSRVDLADQLGLMLLEWPPAPGPGFAPGLPGVDGILVRAARDLPALWSMRGANLLPVFDETGTLKGQEDFDVSTLSLQQADVVRKMVDQFHERRADLHVDLVRSEDPADRLLSRVHVSGGRLEARHSHRHDGLIAWNTICDPADIPDLLRRLEADSLVSTTFFERVHVCAGCRSARMIVREECPSCHSAHLEDESYLHHFRCATQAPESEFVRGDDLICPKCRRALQHFGRDYDRPGIMTRCKACAAATVDPVVAFVCARCETRSTAEATPVMEAYSANLSETGLTYLRSGATFLGPARRALRFGDFPLELVFALNKAAAAYNEAQTPFTLGSISYEGLEEIRTTSGALRARDTRRLWLESLQQAMYDRVVVANSHANDYVFLPDVKPSAAAAEIERARRVADAAVSADLRVSLRLFGAEDIAR